MEIQEGEYVRTVQGTIAKIEVIEFDIGVKIDTGLLVYRRVMTINDTDYVKKEVIKKHSFKIKDLVEDGDFVNGYPVRKINGKLCNFDLNEMEWTPLENIDVWENIVTKEEFERRSYKVGE